MQAKGAYPQVQDGMGTPALPEPPSLPGDGVAPSDEVFAAHPTGLTLPNMPSSEADGVGDVAALYRESTRELHRRLEELQTLPGVGRKTANVVLNTAFGEEVFAVDTHVFRVSNRTGLAPGKTPDEVEAKLDKVVPQPFRRDAHHWLILHGRYVCKARTPECWRCVVADLCRFEPKTPPPAAKARSDRTSGRASSAAHTG